MATFTATVSSGNGTPTGTVTFTDGATTLCSNVALSSGIATCSPAFSAEGTHSILATYNPTGSFLTSNGSLTQTVRNHSTIVSGAYCNTAAMSIPGQNTAQPYPSFINVGTDTTAIANSLSSLTLTIKGISSAALGGLSDARMVLVSPGGSHTLDFLDFAGGNTAFPLSNLTFDDTAASQIPFNFSSTPPGGNQSFRPSSYKSAFVFPAPAPASYNNAAPGGGASAKTFTSAFNGTSPNGDWALYIADNANRALSITGGWCLNFTQASGIATTTTVAGSPNRSNGGAAVAVTATVRNSSTNALITIGTVTFTENGNTLAAAVPVSNGVASFNTSTLSEGDHTITATYNDVTNTNSLSFGSYVQRVDNATGAPTVNGNIFTFCNPGAIVIPGPNNASNIGAASPNPSNIFASNVPGTLTTVGVDLKTAHFDRLDFISSLLVGPGQNTAAAFDFFSQTGNGTAPGSGNYSFADANASLVPTGAIAAGNYKPTSYGAASTFFGSTSGFFTLQRDPTIARQRPAPEPSRACTAAPIPQEPGASISTRIFTHRATGSTTDGAST